jgi:hypothetical protein
MPAPIPDHIPDSVRWKLLRAQEHLAELGVETQRYYKKNPAKVMRQEYGSPDEFIGKIVPAISIPARIPLIIGDFLQNLRSSLDYLVWELVLAAKNTPTKDNMFPICITPQLFNQQLTRGRLQGIPVDAVAEIEALQPYHSGKDAEGSVLAVIDNLCNINKHRRVIMTMFRGGMAPSDFVTTEIDGQMYGSLNFSTLLNEGAKIGPFPIVDGPQGPGLKMNVPLQLVAFVAFNEGAAQDVEVGFALSILAGYVVQSMANFEKFFV